MKDKKAFTHRIGDFIAGKGFYVVLLICTAVIVISAWILLSSGNLADEPETENIASVSEESNEAMISPDDGIADALASDDVQADAKAPEESIQHSPSPSESASSPSEVTDEAQEKGAISDAEDMEEVMAEELVFVWPLIGDIAVMYAVDELIYDETMDDWRSHDGIDIAGMLGAKVMAAADGSVIDIYEDDMLGTTVVIDHGNGLQSIYANLAKIPVVEKGDKVAMGAVIGAIGYTAIGESNVAPHLHFSMAQDGEPVDPSSYLPKR